MRDNTMSSIFSKKVPHFLALYLTGALATSVLMAHRTCTINLSAREINVERLEAAAGGLLAWPIALPFIMFEIAVETANPGLKAPCEMAPIASQ